MTPGEEAIYNSSIYYLKDKLSKDKVIDSLTGYYLLTLKNRWHIPKAS